MGEQKRREESNKTARDNGTVYVDESESIRVNPLYQQLKRDLFDTKTKIETLTIRLSETKLILKTELERARRIHGGEAAMAELTRDYEVNRDIYQDLLKRRENARVSKNLNRDKQGLTIRVQDPAVLPLQPAGIRFIHFVLGGFFLSFIGPPALIYGLQLADPRIRFSSLISDKLKLPVLAEVPHLVTPSEVAAISRGFKLHLILIFLTLGFVVTISLFKLIGVV